MRTMHPFLPALGVAVLVTACGPTDNSSTAREKQLEEYARQHGVDADIQLGADGQVTVRQQIGGVSVSSGQNLAVPDDFPGDVAVYPGMKILSASATPAGYMLLGQAGATPEAVAGFFAGEMVGNGWRDESPQAASGSPTTSLHYIKDQRSTRINLIHMGDRVTVQIMIAPTG